MLNHAFVNSGIFGKSDQNHIVTPCDKNNTIKIRVNALVELISSKKRLNRVKILYFLNGFILNG
jgi:hypothetical protein